MATASIVFFLRSLPLRSIVWHGWNVSSMSSHRNATHFKVGKRQRWKVRGPLLKQSANGQMLRSLASSAKLKPSAHGGKTGSML